MRVGNVSGLQIQPLRADFKKGLEHRIDGFLGPKGSQSRVVLERSFDKFLTGGKFDIEKLPEEARKELGKLEKASEQFEAHFVKDLLSQMRKVKFSDEKVSEMTDFAYEQMDQAVADSTSRGQGSIGIGKSIFESMGDMVVKRSIGQAALSQTPKNKDKSE